jgi:hypothetical protein
MSTNFNISLIQLYKVDFWIMTRFGSSIFDECIEVVIFFMELWYIRHIILHHSWVPGSIICLIPAQV